MKKVSNGSNQFSNLINDPSLTLFKGKGKFFLLFFLLVLFFPADSFSQLDSAKKGISPAEKKGEAEHSPRKAMIFSAVVPGLGQAYNKKYWKIPVVYASIGTTLYFFDYNNKLYKDYKKAYVYKTDKDPGTVDLYPHYTEDDMRELSSYYRRYRDLNMILTGLFYTLNIMDAYVDAQLLTFDVSDDLSMNVHPAFNVTADKRPFMGAGISVNF